ncbi:MAG: S46 family peptidase [Bacteroidetes bacterium]|nr:S46 family peptidase [Bacteroidota bacterium]
MKRTFALIITLLAFFINTKADEGMWLPLFIERLNYVDMQKEGLHLTAEEIYSVNHNSLKDAIIMFGGGCTGEMVSAEGLVFTNHHCGYGAIQSHSSVDHDFLADGFWAMRKEEELPNDNLTARFLVRIEDVTNAALQNITPGMSEADRLSQIRENTKKLEADAVKGTQYDARVGSFFNGNEYYLFVYEVFKDVRLVGAPPSSIGKFGADTDNWMWPRHTGDFSIFRVYAGPDNKPAAYSKQNVPYKPNHFLPVSNKGVKKDQFSMIMGYPGTTDRYATSYTIDWALEHNNPAVVKIRTKKLEILRQDMDADHDVRIKYASKYAGTANYWKFFIGQNKGLRNLKVLDRKRAQEKEFTAWVNASPGRIGTFGEALPDIEKAYAVIDKYETSVRYNSEAILRGCEIIAFARQLAGLQAELSKEKPDPKALQDLVNKARMNAAAYFKNYNAPTDQKMLAAMLDLYYKDVPPDQQPPLLSEIFKKSKSDFSEFSMKVFEKSMFADAGRLEVFLANPSLKKLSKDPAFVLQKVFASNSEAIDNLVKPGQELLTKGRRLYVKGLQEMNPDTKFYPDANSTMRLTYGKVLDYSPADAVDYGYQTTLSGVMQKEDPTNWEFTVPEKLKQLYKDKDYGPYAEKGEMPVAFLTTNDITGGNSGSPVLNGDGELIGLAFDGNWEAMSGNYAFEPELQRTICVDVRYVLFIIDKFAGANNLIHELDIRN